MRYLVHAVVYTVLCYSSHDMSYPLERYNKLNANVCMFPPKRQAFHTEARVVQSPRFLQGN